MRGIKVGRLVLLGSALVLGAAGPVQASDYHWRYRNYVCTLSGGSNGEGFVTARAKAIEHGWSGAAQMRIRFVLQQQRGGYWYNIQQQTVTSTYFGNNGLDTTLAATRGWDFGSASNVYFHRIKFVYFFYSSSGGLLRKASLAGYKC